MVKLPAQKLDLPGMEIQSTISLWLYFIPDLDMEIHLEEAVEVIQFSPGLSLRWCLLLSPCTLRQVRDKQLNEEYLVRAKTFWQTMSRPVRDTIEAAIKLELGKPEDYELDREQINRFMSAEDQVSKNRDANLKRELACLPGEYQMCLADPTCRTMPPPKNISPQDGITHFFCEYLTPVLPPSEMSSPESIARRASNYLGVVLLKCRRPWGTPTAPHDADLTTGAMASYRV